MRTFVCWLLSFLLSCAVSYSNAQQIEVHENVEIVIQTDSGEILGTLEQSAAAKAFAEQLPLELTLEDYHSTEKIADLPVRLPIQGSPKGIKPAIGDLTYYAPWGNLAIFYKDFGYANGLIRLGHIEGDLSLLKSATSVRVRIERASPATNNR